VSGRAHAELYKWTDAHGEVHYSDKLPVEAVNGTAHVLQRDSRANIATWRTRLTATEIERVREATAAVSPRFYGEDEW